MGNPSSKEDKKAHHFGGKGCLTVLLLTFVGFIFFSANVSDRMVAPPRPSALPAIESYLNENPQYGKLLKATDQPNWAQGKRQQIRTTSGEYLFYLDDKGVSGIWKYNSGGGRTQIYRK